MMNGAEAGCEFQAFVVTRGEGSCGLAKLGDEAAFSCSTMRVSMMMLVF